MNDTEGKKRVEMTNSEKEGHGGTLTMKKNNETKEQKSQRVTRLTCHPSD